MSKKGNLKRVLLCAVFFAISFMAFAYSSPQSLTDAVYAADSTITNETLDTEKIVNNVIESIIYVESRGNVNAVNGSCCGPMQISIGMVKTCNKILKELGSSERFDLQDRFDLDKSKEMFKLFNKKYNPSFNISKAIRSWKGGLGYTINSTQSYYNKVMKYYKQLE